MGRISSLGLRIPFARTSQPDRDQIAVWFWQSDAGLGFLHEGVQHIERIPEVHDVDEPIRIACDGFAQFVDPRAESSRFAATTILPTNR